MKTLYRVEGVTCSKHLHSRSSSKVWFSYRCFSGSPVAENLTNYKSTSTNCLGLYSNENEQTEQTSANV